MQWNILSWSRLKGELKWRSTMVPIDSTAYNTWRECIVSGHDTRDTGSVCVVTVRATTSLSKITSVSCWEVVYNKYADHSRNEGWSSGCVCVCVGGGGERRVTIPNSKKINNKIECTLFGSGWTPAHFETIFFPLQCHCLARSVKKYKHEHAPLLLTKHTHTHTHTHTQIIYAETIISEIIPKIMQV